MYLPVLPLRRRVSRARSSGGKVYYAREAETWNLSKYQAGLMQRSDRYLILLLMWKKGSRTTDLGRGVTSIVIGTTTPITLYLNMTDTCPFHDAAHATFNLPHCSFPFDGCFLKLLRVLCVSV